MVKRIGSSHSRIRIAWWVLFLLGVMASAAWAQGTGNGLYGEYYNNINFTGTLAVRTDPVVDFDWGAANPPAPATLPAGITPPDTFSVRWRGWIESPFTETYTFFITSDDGSRLYLNGTLLIDNWRDQGPTTMTATFSMTAGQKVPIMVEYYENGGGAMVRLEWQSLSTARAVVPQIRLYSAAPAAAPTVTPNGGLLPATVSLATTTPGATLYYTLDGTDPGLSAPGANARLFSGPFTLAMSYVRIVARAYVPDGVPSNSTVSNVFSPLFDPIALPPGTVPGVSFRYYHLANPQVLPNFEPLLPQRRGVLANFGIVITPARDRNDQFGFKHAGFVNIPADGEWTFFSGSDDGSKLYIGPHEVVSNDGLHGFPGPSPSGRIQLKAGWHPITVVMFENGGGEALAVQWQGPGVPASAAIPDANLATLAAAATPAATPAGGTFAGSQLVTLNTATPGATIFYTTDGTAPDPRSATASGASGLSFTITATTRVRALAAAPGLHPSDVLDATFTRTDTPPRALSVSAAGVATQVLVLFDKPVTDPTASTAANYSIDNGVTVSAAALVPKTGALRGHWRLDDLTGSDSSGNGNTATLVNAPLLDPVDVAPVGFANPASLVFDGVDDHASVPSSASLNFGASSFTVSLWIRPNDTTNRRVMNKWDGPGDKGWIMDINSTAGNLRFRVDDGPNSTDLNTGAGVAANQWQHVAGRCDRIANQVSIFRNGVLIAAANMSAAFGNADTAVPVLLGRLENPAGTPSGNHFNGRMDDVRTYGVALSNAEIAALAGGLEQVSSTVRLTTSALAAGTNYTLTVRNVQDAAGNALPSAGATSPFRFFATGTITREVWNGIGGNTIPDLARNANYPNNPSAGDRPTLFEGPTNFADNYGTRMRGFFIPNATGNWRFAIASDDNSQLWLGRDDDPSTKVLVSRCTAWSNAKDYADPDIAQSAPLPLVSGQKYYIEAFQKEGGGGDNLSVAAKVDDGTPIAAGVASIPGSLIAPYDDATVLLAQPVGRVVLAGQGAVFTVLASGAGPLTYQWRKDGTNLAGATAASFTIAGATAAEAGTYSVVVANGVSSVTSANAVLTVLPAPAPSLSAVTPTLGPTYGGQTVTVSGTELLFGLASLQIGGVNASNLYYSPDGQSLIARTPPHGSGLVDVSVATPGGAATLVAAFTYYDTPSIAGVAPSGGPVAGGQTVTITGTNFVDGQTAVSFDASPASSITVTSPTSLTAVTPLHAAGAVTVTVTTPFGSGAMGGAYTYFDPPTITAISPADGPAGGGQAVTLDGTHFVTSQTTVTFDAASAAITSFQVNRLVVSTPPHAAGSVVVIVTTPGGQAATSYTYHNPPTIAAVTPNAGPSAGGQAVSLTGSNFVSGQTTVAFGGAAAGVTSVAPGQVDAITPAHASGAVDVAVTTPGGSATAAASYTYHDPPTISSISPGAGPSAGGQTVTLTGTNFAPGRTAVTFGGAPGSSVVVVPNGTSLSVTSPVHAAGTVDVVVVTPGGSVIAPGAYVYHDAPTVSGVSPSSGTTQGGQTVTVTGSNFVTGQTTVAFGGAAGTNVVVTGPGSLTVSTPAHATGTVDVVVTTPGGAATAAASYTYAGPFISTVNPVAGPVVGGQAVTLSGTGFVPGATSVTFGGVAATVNSVTSTSVTLTSPPAAGPGTVDVTGTTPDGSFTAFGAYDYVGSPTITSVSPTRGPASGGAAATIEGTNFAAGNTRVTLGGAPATITSISVTQIVVTTPAHAQGVVDVVVTTFGNQTATATGAYTYVPPPTVSSIAPNRGPTGGGRSVTIRGTDFEPGLTGVSIGGAPAAGVVVDPDGTRLTATTGAHGPGTFDVVATTFGLQSGSLPAAYTYVDPSTAADLGLAKTVSTATPTLGQDVTFLLTVSNSGGIAATGVRVTDLLPAGLVFVSASATQGTYDPGSGEWTVGSVSTGSSASLSIVATVTTSASITNVAEITASDVPDVDSTAGNGVVEEDDRATASLAAALSIVTKGPLPSTTSGATYFQPFVAVAGVAPYRWSLEDGALPFNLDPRTGLVSGTAPVVGASTDFSFTLSVSDAQDPPATHSGGFTITVLPANAAAPVIHLIPAPSSGTVGSAYSHVFTAMDGQPPYAWSLFGGTLPPGTDLNARTGELAGTPASAGSFAFTVRAMDAAGLAATQTFSVDVNPQSVVVETESVPHGMISALYHRRIEASGGIGPTFTWTVLSGSLPGGLTLSGTGRTATLSGMPATPGTFSFTVRLSDGGQPGVSATRPYSLAVAGLPPPGPGIAPVKCTTDRLSEGTVGRAYSVQLAAIGGRTPYIWGIASGRLPAGLSLTSSGLLAGTCSEDGFFPFTVQAAGSGSVPSSDARSFVLVVAPALFIVSGSPLPSAVLGEAYFEPLSAMGGVPPYGWSVSSGALPAGITLSPTSGALAGVASGTSGTFTLSVTEANGASASGVFTLTVLDPASGPTVVTSSLPRAEVDVPYSATLAVVGGTPPHAWSLASGTLPTWLGFEGSSGAASGAPPAPGLSILTFQVMDASGPPPATALSGSLTLESIPRLDVDPTSVPAATETTPYSATLTATGAVGPVYWTLVGGALPEGLSLESSTGTLSGQTGLRGTYPLRVRATDSLGRTAQRQVRLTVGHFNPAGSSGQECSATSISSGPGSTPVRLLLLSAAALLLGLGRGRRGLRMI